MGFYYRDTYNSIYIDMFNDKWLTETTIYNNRLSGRGKYPRILTTEYRRLAEKYGWDTDRLDTDRLSSRSGYLVRHSIIDKNLVDYWMGEVTRPEATFFENWIQEENIPLVEYVSVAAMEYLVHGNAHHLMRSGSFPATQLTYCSKCEVFFPSADRIHNCTGRCKNCRRIGAARTLMPSRRKYYNVGGPWGLYCDACYKLFKPISKTISDYLEIEKSIMQLKKEVKNVKPKAQDHGGTAEASGVPDAGGQRGNLHGAVSNGPSQTCQPD